MFQKFYLKKLFVVFLLILALSVSYCDVGDRTDPAAINDLSFDCSTETFSWTATGDDADEVLAAIYDLRFFEAAQMAALLGVPVESLGSVPGVAIVEAFRENFSDAIQLTGEPEPLPAGEPQTFTDVCPCTVVVGEGESSREFIFVTPFSEAGEIFFAITARDEVGNQASIESVLRTDCPDTELIGPIP